MFVTTTFFFHKKHLLYLKCSTIHCVYFFNVQNKKVNLLTKMMDHSAKFLQVCHKLWSGAGTKVNHQGPS